MKSSCWRCFHKSVCKFSEAAVALKAECSFFMDNASIALFMKLLEEGGIKNINGEGDIKQKERETTSSNNK